MARAVAAALVLCAAVLVAAAHTGRARVLEYQALEAGIEAAEAALAPLAGAAPPPASADVAADAGGVREDREVWERSTAIGDVLWYVLQWANEAANGDRRKAY